MKKLHGLQIMIGLAIFGGRIPGMIEIALRVNVFGQVLRLMLDTIAPKSHSTFIAMLLVVLVAECASQKA